MDNAGKNALFPYAFGISFILVDRKSVTPCRLNDIDSARSVTGDAAVGTGFFERHPFSVISRHHCKRSRTTFEGFEL